MTPFRSGFCAVVGRPNVGKSTLVNAMVGTKVTITSPRPNTTRAQVRGVINRPDAQVVLVDTPGLHKPRSLLGQRMNDSATSSLDDVDVVLCMVEASAAVGPGDRMALLRSADRMRAMAGAPRPEGAGADPDGPPGGVGGEGDEGSDEGSEVHDGRPTLLVVVNKIDTVGPDGILGHLAAVAAVIEESDRQAGVAVPVEYFPVSATTGEGVDALIAAVIERLPEGPRYYPEGMVTDVAEAFWVADLVREELLHRVEDELPHSIACRVTEWEWPRVRCEILVERDSQKGIVIGKGGSTLKEVGTAVRAQMPPGAFLELFVRVEKRWQHREDALDRLGL
jgi:GTP-binding protein Era